MRIRCEMQTSQGEVCHLGDLLLRFRRTGDVFAVKVRVEVAYVPNHPRAVRHAADLP